MVSRRTWRAGAALTATAALVLVGIAPAVADVPAESFDDGPGAWVAYGHEGAIDTSGGTFCVDVPAGSAQYGVGVLLNGVEVEQGTTYTLAFSASATTDVTVRALVGQNGAPYGTVVDKSPALTSELTDFSYEFTAGDSYPATATPDEPEGQIAFQLGGFSPDAWTFCLDDVSLSSDVELLPHTSFAESLGPWGLYGGSDPVFTDGGVCTTLPGGQTNPWDAGLAFTGIPVEEGQNYVLTFTAKATPDTPVRVIVGEGGGAYRTTFEQASVPLTSELTTYTYPFTANLTFPADGAAPGQLAFHLGKSAGVRVLHHGRLAADHREPAAAVRARDRAARARQPGRLRARGPEARDPRDRGDRGRCRGSCTTRPTPSSRPATTTPEGTDGSTDLNVHVIDFSDVTTAGAGYTLVADGETSRPFDIDADLYQQLRQDTLDYFYLARSGTPIDGAIVGDEYARAAGHVGVAPNQGDTEVPCIGPRDYYDGWTCDYTLDVSGGWYDAGDHGKYVVNGGISVAQLLGTYERTLTASSATPGALGDGTLDLPEHGNDVPDVLDEARWELEWMQKMIAPVGRVRRAWCTTRSTTRAGPACRSLPANDPQVRSLHRPSTAATLNVAAVAAQGARLFREYDPAFADSLLADGAVDLGRGARAPGRLRTRRAAGADGGGPYDDTDVTRRVLLGGRRAVPHHGRGRVRAGRPRPARSTRRTSSRPTGSTGASVAALGRIDLATVPSDLPGLDDGHGVGRRRRGRVRRQPGGARRSARSTRPPSGTYDVGLQLVGGQQPRRPRRRVRPHRRRDVQPTSVLEGMDYLLGRNGLNQSYVTGWGEVASHQQHSRWFAHSLDPALPEPPAGLAGRRPELDHRHVGPDDAGRRSPQGCAPSMCYLDVISSWASNEITVNWNSAMSWVASFVADQGAGAPVQVAPAITQQPASVTAPSARRRRSPRRRPARPRRRSSGRSSRPGRGRTSSARRRPRSTSSSPPAPGTARCSPTRPARRRRRWRR